MISLQEQFRNEIEAFLQRHQMDAKTFGRNFMRDPRFVIDIRRGRSCSVATVDKVRHQMAAHHGEELTMVSGTTPPGLDAVLRDNPPEPEANSPDALFPDRPADAVPTARHATGILPHQVIKEMVRGREIQGTIEVLAEQIQPASIDLRLGDVAYRVRASFLPGAAATVQQKVDLFGMHQIDLSRGAVLEKGCVYIVPLIEHLALSGRISGLANPKSSTGRLDVFTRLITDHATEFERVEPGYAGPLYVEISPHAFSIVVRQGSRLNQLRFRRGTPAPSDTAIRRLHEQVGLVDRELGARDISNGLPLTVDLDRAAGTQLIGFKAKAHAGLVDVDAVGYYEPLDYWEPIFAGRDPALILNPDDFYVLASKEAVTVPPDHAAEMHPYDTLVGEFRAHYAGFFDPGFGHGSSGGSGTRAVLEVRPHEVPFVIEDGQVVGRLVYERLTDLPDIIYGPSIGSSYQGQGLQLGKQFKPLEPGASDAA